MTTHPPATATEETNVNTEKLIDNPADLAAAYGLTWPADACNCCGGRIVDGRCLGAEKCDSHTARRCAGLTAEEPKPCPQPCPHDTIAESAGLRVCLDCGMENPKRRRTA